MHRISDPTKYEIEEEVEGQFVATLHVEYCSEKESKDRFLVLLGQVNRQCPHVKVVGRKGRKSSFEVTIDEKIIFSKLVEGEYPEPVALMKAVVDYVRFGRLPKRVRTDTPRCLIS